MFVKDDSAARVKTVAEVYQGQPAPIPIGNNKYTNASTELGFFIDEQNIIVNAYFDPAQSVLARGYNLVNLAYAQIGQLRINNFPVPITTHDPSVDVRQLGFPLPNEDQNVGFVDAFATPIPARRLPSIPSTLFANYQFAQDSRFRVSTFSNFPQDYGSFVSMDRRQGAAAPAFAAGKYKKVLMRKAVDMNPLGLDGALTYNQFFSTYDFSIFDLTFEFPEDLTRANIDDFGFVNALLDRGIIPQYNIQDHLENTSRFRDTNGNPAFNVYFELPADGREDSYTGQIVFGIWDNAQQKYGSILLPLDEIESEYEEAYRTIKVPDGEAILAPLEQFGYKRTFADASNIEMKYLFFAAPSAFYFKKLHDVTIGYNIRLLEGFAYHVTRKYTALGGWQNTVVSAPIEFNPNVQNYNAGYFRKLLTEQLKDTNGKDFQVKFL